MKMAFSENLPAFGTNYLKTSANCDPIFSRTQLINKTVNSIRQIKVLLTIISIFQKAALLLIKTTRGLLQKYVWFQVKPSVVFTQSTCGLKGK